jgi:hypothetical protein
MDIVKLAKRCQYSILNFYYQDNYSFPNHFPVYRDTHKKIWVYSGNSETSGHFTVMVLTGAILTDVCTTRGDAKAQCCWDM